MLPAKRESDDLQVVGGPSQLQSFIRPELSPPDPRHRFHAVPTLADWASRKRSRQHRALPSEEDRGHIADRRARCPDRRGPSSSSLATVAVDWLFTFDQYARSPESCTDALPKDWRCCKDRLKRRRWRSPGGKVSRPYPQGMGDLPL